MRLSGGTLVETFHHDLETITYEVATVAKEIPINLHWTDVARMCELGLMQREHQELNEDQQPLWQTYKLA